MNKDKEKTIFDFIYADRTFDSVVPSEEPDFRIKNAHGEFGVEITEFYFSQSQARIQNISGYLEEIIDQKRYRHKDDIDSLQVKEITVIPGDNRSEDFNVFGIVQEQPLLDEYIKKISELIENKNKKFKSYIRGLTHVNLIIFDREQRMVGAPRDRFHHLFFQPQLERTLMNADFREIFLVTHLGEFGSSKHVYIPLKMLFLVAEVYLFNHILIEEYPLHLQTYSENRSLWCAEYLTWRGAKNIYCKDVSDGCEVRYGNAGIFISKDSKISVRDHRDFALPGDFNLITAPGVSSIFDDAFLRVFEKYKHDCVFSMELCFDVNSGKGKP